MLTDKIHSRPREAFEILDDLRGDKVFWSASLRPISLSLVKDLEAHSAKAAVNIIDMGKLLLQYAKDGDLSKVHELMARGAPFTTDWLGMSALHFAAMHNKYEVCQVLLRGGVNKDAKTKVDRTPLHIAACEGHDEIVKLLLSKNCDVNPIDMLRMTPLHWAVEKGHKNIIKLLLKHGANVTAISKFNKTPISIAMQMKQTDILAELEIEKERQEREGPKVSLENTQSETETHQAVKSIADSCNYDIISNLNEELASAEKISQEGSKIGMKIAIKDEMESETNRSETCHSSDDLIDEDMNYVEPIIQLESIDDDQKQLDNSALELLKCHGISMLPADDPENNLISSALQSGRKLVLSEAGRRILNDTKLKHTSEKLSSPKKNERNGKHLEESKLSGYRKPPILLRTKGLPLKPNKNIKIISIDTFKKMYGPEMVSTIRKPQSTNSEERSNTPTITKITKIQNPPTGPLKKIISAKNQPTARIINVQKLARKDIEDEEELPPNIEVCSDSDMEEGSAISRSAPDLLRIPSTTLVTSSKSPTNAENFEVPSMSGNTSKSTNPKSNFQYCVKAPVLSLPEITRQIFILKKQVEDLTKQNLEYRTRIEQLEKEREGGRRRES